MAFLKQSLNQSPASPLASFASAFTQHNRLIALRFLESAKQIKHGTLLPARIEINTALSEDTDMELVCLSADSTVELKLYLGQPIEISILLAKGQYKIISGVVLAAANQGRDNDFTTIVLTIGSMFQTLIGLTQNCPSKALSRRQYCSTARRRNAAGAVLRKS